MTAAARKMNVLKSNPWASMKVLWPSLVSDRSQGHILDLSDVDTIDTRLLFLPG